MVSLVQSVMVRPSKLGKSRHALLKGIGQMKCQDKRYC